MNVTRRYYAYRATVSAGFYLPVSVIYMDAQGLGLAEIGFVQGAFLFAMVLAEIPTGYLGDRLGQRNALAAGSLIMAAVMAGFAVADSTPDFAVLYVTWAVAWTFRSGTADAWLYDYLASQDDADAFTHVSGRANAVLRVVSGVTALVAGVLYAIDPAYPFLANAALTTVGLPLILSLPRVTDADAAHDASFRIRDAIQVLTTELPRPSVRWIVAYAALFNLVFSVTRVFEQPAMRSVGVSVAGLGVTYAAFKFVAAATASQAGAIEDQFGTKTVLAALVPVVAITYASFAIIPVLVVPALFVRRAIQRITRPVRTAYINDQITGVGRATVLSGVSMVLVVVSGTANVIGGHVAEHIGARLLIAVVGVAAALLAGVLWVSADPIRSLQPDPAPGPTPGD